MTVEEIKKDIEAYDNLETVLRRYTNELQYLRDNADSITIDTITYYTDDTIEKQIFAFAPYRTLSGQVLIDSLEQHIKDIEREMADIRTKYKGVIDFEN